MNALSGVLSFVRFRKLPTNMKQSKEFETADSSARHVKTLAQALAHKVALDEKELIILLSLLEDAKTSNAELAERLGLSDGNAAAYQIKRLKTPASLTRYTIQIDWRKIGFLADFVILAESDEKAALRRWKGTWSFFRTNTKSTLATCFYYQPLLSAYC